MTSTMVVMICRSVSKLVGGEYIWRRVCTIVITPTIVIMMPAMAEMMDSMAAPIAENTEP